MSKHTASSSTTVIPKEKPLKHGQYAPGSDDFWTPRILPTKEGTRKEVRDSIRPDLSFAELLALRTNHKNAEQKSTHPTPETSVEKNKHEAPSRF